MATSVKFSESHEDAEDVEMDGSDQELEQGEDLDESAGEPVPRFPPLSAAELRSRMTAEGDSEFRRVPVPPHRYTPLREQWQNIMSPLVEHMKLQVRFNPKNRSVELKTSEFTSDAGALQKGTDFVQAFVMGFELQDAIALLRLDDLFIDTFEVKDVKILHGDHLSRAIGRIAGQGGKTKFAIENATRTRIVLADEKVHILGSFANIKVARDAISRLIMGAPPGKVYNLMRNHASRANERF
jgi:RNA-binding protein PNO1